jgi:ATP-dependent DNA helicase RecG
MNKKELEFIIKQGEGQFLEFKENFDKSSDIMIEVYRNKLVVFNPGGLVKWLKPEEFGTISKTRNPIIASLLSRTIFVEKMGTGINRIKKAMKLSNLPNPEFKFYEHSFYANLFDRTIITGKEKDLEKGFEKTVGKIILAIKKNPKITQKELETITGLKRRGIEWNIKKLKKEGRIKRVGPAKGGHWEVTE